MRRKGSQGLDSGICSSLGFQGEEWLVPHGEPAQQIVMAGNGEVLPEGRVVSVRCCQGGALDDSSKMRSLVLETRALITYQRAGERMIQKLAVKWNRGIQMANQKYWT